MINEKTNELNELFAEWKSSSSKYRNSFKCDGIVDENKFEPMNPKVLFITKEPNDPKQKVGDYREWWKKKIKYSFSLRIAEWSHGILNGFPTYDSFKNDDTALLEALHSVAFMNLKKIGGKGSSKKKEILEHLKRDFKFIHNEINIIKPDIIITGLTWKSVRQKLFQPDVKWIESGYSVAIGTFNGARVIDFYHPSSRTAPSASYSLLQNVINSDAFKNLK